jgi:hypothetical protein
MARKYNTDNMDIGGERSIIIPGSGEIDKDELLEDFGSQYEAVDPSANIAKLLEEERFMNEKIEVVVNESGNPLDPIEIPVCHNGIWQTFIRGMPKWVKRKFVYVLASVKTENIRTQEVVGRDNEKSTELKSFFTPTHHITILNDPNPKGHGWLQTVRAERS